MYKFVSEYEISEHEEYTEVWTFYFRNYNNRLVYFKFGKNEIRKYPEYINIENYISKRV